MQDTDYEFVIIGSGPAGYSAAVQACKLGAARVAMLERHETLGGVTLLSGTIPSKTLREAILYLRGVRQRPFYGMDFTEKQDITVSDLFVRVRKVVDRQTATMDEQLKGYRDRIHVFRGYHATLESPNSVHAWLLKNPMESVTLRAEKILIATGSRPRHIPDIPIDNEVIFDSDSAFTLELQRETLPESLIVVGAGVIGAEYGSAFAVLGCNVWLVQHDRDFLTFAERPLVDMLVRRMEDFGVEFVWDGVHEKIERTPEGRARVRLADGRVLEADALIVAKGREVASKVLGLEDVGVDVTRHGLIKVNELFQTSVPSIYAAGDVIGFPALASTSSEQGRMAASYALGRRVGGRRNLFPMCIYTIPEVAMVGYTQKELQAKGIPYAVGQATYEEVTKAGIIGDEHGMLSLLFEPNAGHLLGVHIIGDQACELIHVGQAVLSHNGSIDYFIDNVFSFPTLGEAYKIAALDGVKKVSERASKAR